MAFEKFLAMYLYTYDIERKVITPEIPENIEKVEWVENEYLQC